MLSNNNIDIDNLLAKHFAKELLSHNEAEMLERWKKKNQKEYLHLKSLINHRATDLNVDTDKAWEKILSKKKKRATKPYKVFNVSPKKVFSYGIAASFILFLGIWTWVHFYGVAYEEYYNNNMLAMIYTLPDNTTVTLNADTRLRYFTNSKDARKTELLSGEAFFEVQPNKENPFIITTKHAEIRVLGTSFNVKLDTKKAEVAVKTGKVLLSNRFDENITLTKGQRGVVNSDIISKENIENENYLAWKTRRLTFKNVSLYDATKELEAYYHVQIHITKECKDCYFTTTFTTESLDEAMKEIKALTKIEYEIKDKEVNISCENCN